MRGLGLTLCRVLALLACFVCASGYATSAVAQPLSSQQSALRDAGAIVVDDSTKAAQLAGAIAVRANAPTRSATWVERH